MSHYGGGGGDREHGGPSREYDSRRGGGRRGDDYHREERYGREQDRGGGDYYSHRGGGGGGGGGYQGSRRDDHQGDGRERGGGRRDDHQRGGGGRGGPPRDGGRGGGGLSELQSRALWERKGLDVQVNLFKLKFFTTGTEQTWYQYHVQIHNLKKKKDKEGKFLKDNKGEFIFEVGRSIFDDRDLETTDDHDGGFEIEQAKARQARRNRSSHVTRRIMTVLQREQQLTNPNFQLLSDGGNLAISRTRITQDLDKEGEACSPVDVKRPSKKMKPSEPGIYGPADSSGSAPAPELNPISKPCKVFPPIRVRKDCDEDDPEAALSPFRWFQVKITEVGSIKFTVDPRDGSIKEVSEGAAEQCCQAINLAVKNAMLVHMLAMDRDPRLFFFKNNPFQGIGKLNIHFNANCMPIYGLLKTARQTKNGISLLVDLGLGWQKVESNPQKNDDPIPLLQPDRHGEGGTLAGIHLTSLKRQVPPEQRLEVHEALQRASFHVRYKLSEEWITEMVRSKPVKVGDSYKHWKDRAKRVLKNRRMEKMVPAKDGDDGSNIKWAANDKTVHSFEFAYFRPDGTKEEPCKISVFEYYLKRYKLRLKFPDMPLVRISKKEWFPVEFLFVAHGAAAKGTNVAEQNEIAERKTKHALAFNDAYACSDRIEKIKELLQNKDVLDNLTQKLKLLQIEMEKEPMRLKSKVLKFPRLVYGMKRDVMVQNGSWNLKDSKFDRPATMHSFAVVNLTGRDLLDLPEQILDALRRHGISLPFLGHKAAGAANIWREVANTPHRQPNTPDMVRECFKSAQDRAKEVFMIGQLRHNLCFHTLVRVSDAAGNQTNVMDAVVLPKSLVHSNRAQQPEQGYYAVLEWNHFDASCPTARPSHLLTLRNHGQVEAWLQYHLDLPNGPDVNLNPSELFVRNIGESIEILDPDGSWMSIERDKIWPVFYANDQYYKWDDDNVTSFELKRPYNKIKVSEIECPSLVFVILQRKTKEEYYSCKGAGYLGIGVNSQVIVLESYQRQKNPHQKMQFCSNIALKVNTKLATKIDNARAWCWADKFSDGSDDPERCWLKEARTLIISLTMASEQGQGSKTVVVGDALLNIDGLVCCYEARLQRKSHLVHRAAMKDIFKNLIWSFVLKNMDTPPRRIIIIRSSAHEGHFRDILDQEISAVREAYLEARPPEQKVVVCQGGCDGKGCHLCCPLITCLVAQSSHNNIRLVLDPKHEDLSSVAVLARKPPYNVPSGTCVDGSSLLFPQNQDVLQHERELAESSGALKVFVKEAEITGYDGSDFMLVSHGGLKGTSNGILYRIILNENGVLGDPDTTPLTGPMLQRLVYCLSFLYGKATKAPRDTALVRTGALLAQNVLGIISSMNRDEFSAYFANVDPTHQQDDVYRIRAGGSSLLPFFSLFRAISNMDDAGAETGDAGANMVEAFRPHLLS